MSNGNGDNAAYRHKECHGGAVGHHSSSIAIGGALSVHVYGRLILLGSIGPFFWHYDRMAGELAITTISVMKGRGEEICKRRFANQVTLSR